MITNTTNKKKYIGQTASALRKRFNQHCEPRNNTVIAKAIRKYGTNKFKIKVLQNEIKTKKEANSIEIALIKKYKTLSPNGYNVEKGGNAYPMSKSSRQKISNKLKGRKITWGNKVSVGVKKLWEDPIYRKKQTKQRHKKRGNYRTGIVRLKNRCKINTNKLEKDYHDYMHLDKICKKYKISLHTLYRIIKRENISKRGYKCHSKTV